MNTKIFSIFLISLLMASFMIAGVFALQNNNLGSQALNATNEDSMAAKSIFWSNIKFLFTADKSEKAAIALSIANRHSLNAEEAIAKGDIKKAEAELKKSDNMSDKAKSVLDGMNINGNTENALEAFIKSKQKFEERRLFVQEVHQRVLDKHTDKMTSEQLAHIEEAFTKSEEGLTAAGNALDQRAENIQAIQNISNNH